MVTGLDLAAIRRGPRTGSVITTEADEYVRIVVEEVEYDGGPVAIGAGRTPEGRFVRFASEPRYLRDIIAALADGEQPVAAIPRWAILGSDAGAATVEDFIDFLKDD